MYMGNKENIHFCSQLVFISPGVSNSEQRSLMGLGQFNSNHSPKSSFSCHSTSDHLLFILFIQSLDLGYIRQMFGRWPHFLNCKFLFPLLLVTFSSCKPFFFNCLNMLWMKHGLLTLQVYKGLMQNPYVQVLTVQSTYADSSFVR